MKLIEFGVLGHLLAQSFGELLHLLGKGFVSAKLQTESASRGAFLLYRSNSASVGNWPIVQRKN